MSFGKISFYIDRDTGLPHILGHGVEPWEATDVLQNAEYDYAGKEGSRIAVGQTRDGRFLRIIYKRVEADNSVFVITAMDLPPKAKKALRRRRRRRP